MLRRKFLEFTIGANLPFFYFLSFLSLASGWIHLASEHHTAFSAQTSFDSVVAGFSPSRRNISPLIDRLHSNPIVRLHTAFSMNHRRAVRLLDQFTRTFALRHFALFSPRFVRRLFVLCHSLFLRKLPVASSFPLSASFNIRRRRFSLTL
jgi:hypothetical protein